jgi:KaiC/GvpD/RAD55 family RecA-like ATPase
MDPKYERQMVTRACSHPKFFGRTAHEVNPALLGSEVGKLALEAARAIFVVTKKGPESLMMVIQQLQTWRVEGKVTQEKVAAVSDYFDDAADEGLDSVEAVEGLLLPILQRRLDKQAALAGMDAYGKNQDFSNVESILARKKRLGIQDLSIGHRLGPELLQDLKKAKSIITIPTGVEELDRDLGGGVPRGQMLVWIAGPGGGKSMALSHSSAHSLTMGLHVAYATLELPEHVVRSRVMSNLVGIPINDLLASEMKVLELFSRIETMGIFTVKHFTAHSTTVEDITEWVKTLEEQNGAPIDKLQIDYCDKLVSFSTKEKAGGDYISMREVYERTRIYGETRNIVCETASQSQGRQEKGKHGGKKTKIDLEHTADSMHKVRVADIVVTNNYDEDNGEMGFWIAKHRTGTSRVMAGPLPTDFKCGAVAPVVRKFMPLEQLLEKVKDDPVMTAHVENLMVKDARGRLT